MPVPNRDPLVLQQSYNIPDPLGVDAIRELNRVSQPIEEAILSFQRRTGTLAVLAACLDPAKKVRQAPRAWHSRLKAELEALGFRASETDPALFCERSGKTGDLRACLGR
jgi:hypothetical protein